jgi:glycerol uptake facilitator-like aquaporin
MLFQRLKVEFLTSFFLIYFSGMAAVQRELGNIDRFGYAFIHFLIYAILLWSSKEISGAQLHPVISFFNSIGPDETVLHAFLYTIIQTMASIFAVCILRTSNTPEGIDLN